MYTIARTSQSYISSLIRALSTRQSDYDTGRTCYICTVNKSINDALSLTDYHLLGLWLCLDRAGAVCQHLSQTMLPDLSPICYCKQWPSKSYPNELNRTKSKDIRAALAHMQRTMEAEQKTDFVSRESAEFCTALHAAFPVKICAIYNCHFPFSLHTQNHVAPVKTYANFSKHFV